MRFANRELRIEFARAYKIRVWEFWKRFFYSLTSIHDVINSDLTLFFCLQGANNRYKETIKIIFHDS